MTFSTLSRAVVSARSCFFATVQLTAGVCLMAIGSPVEAQVNERSSNWIRGVAHVSLDRNGQSQITFNPRRCRELGPELCEFFRTHEYGHVNLRHLERGVPAAQAEAEADRWAAQNASPSAVQAARNYFLSGQGGSRIHGSPQERARRMSSGGSTTTVTKSKARVRTTAPRRYSATPKRIVRYTSKPAVTTLNGKPVVVRSSRTSQTKTSTAAKGTTSRTIRYIVKPTTQRTQVSRRTTSGYVPRGDFLNPR